LIRNIETMRNGKAATPIKILSDKFYAVNYLLTLDTITRYARRESKSIIDITLVAPIYIPNIV